MARATKLIGNVAKGVSFIELMVACWSTFSNFRKNGFNFKTISKAALSLIVAGIAIAFPVAGIVIGITLAVLDDTG